MHAAGARGLHTPKLPPASRNSTIGLPLSVPRTSTKIAAAPLPETASVPVFVVSRSVPFVTSTLRPYGTGPPANGLPFNSTLPVGVPLTAPGGATAMTVRARNCLPPGAFTSRSTLYLPALVNVCPRKRGGGPFPAG